MCLHETPHPPPASCSQGSHGQVPCGCHCTNPLALCANKLCFKLFRISQNTQRQDVSAESQHSQLSLPWSDGPMAMPCAGPAWAGQSPARTCSPSRPGARPAPPDAPPGGTLRAPWRRPWQGLQRFPAWRRAAPPWPQAHMAPARPALCAKRRAPPTARTAPTGQQKLYGIVDIEANFIFSIPVATNTFATGTRKKHHTLD